MNEILYLGLFIPLVGFLVLMFSSDYIGRRLANRIGCSTILISFFCFVSLLGYMHLNGIDSHVTTLYSWIPIEKIHANFTLSLDHLSLLMTLIITGVGFLIHLYSTGYMEHDEDVARYFACMNFFVFSMLLLVLAGHLLLLFVGWEGVGLASYLLIGYYYTRPTAAAAATKAFVINRIGDLGLLLGLLLTFQLFGTGDIGEINAKAGQQFALGATMITVLTLLYFVGATGKSAQLPLYSWLPDAMEGPTPVSALIHAATMVTAGVYLVVRMYPIFLLAPLTLQVMGVVGAITALFASLCALAQTDLKRVLAYSTVSQLGLMFVACGAAAFYSAMFHLTMHAFVKALLFLSAGNVVHMMNGTTNMNHMGGLSKFFRQTHWLFLIGVLALSGIPPLATFFSKDLILDQEYLTGYDFLYYISLIASVLTGVYLTRAYCITFMGETRLNDKILKVVKEAPKIMIIPVSILALLSMIGGFLGFSFGSLPILESFLIQLGVTKAENELIHGSFLSPESITAIIGALLGVGVTAYLYTHYKNHFGHPIKFLKNAFYIDEIYDGLIVTPLKAIAQFFAKFLEPKLFEGSLKALSYGTKSLAMGLQHIQSGQIRSYVAWMVAGSLFMIGYFVLRIVHA